MAVIAKLALLSSAALPGLCSRHDTAAQAVLLQGSPDGAKSPSAMPPIASFSASFEFEGGEGTWAYNAAQDRLAVEFNGHAAYIRPDFKDRMCTKCDLRAETCVTTFRAICFPGLIRSRTEALVRLWRQLPEATVAPEYPSGVEIGGEHCGVWTVTEPGVGLLRICLRADGVPLHLYSSADASFVGPANLPVSTFVLHFRSVSSQPPAIAEAECAEKLADCPLSCPDGGVAPLTVFRASHGEPWGELHDRDTGDLAGDIGFLHPSPGGEPPHRKYLETFKVTVNATWGRWRDCNYIKGDHVCDPAASPTVAKLVARGSAEAYEGPCNGQCGANAVVGSWYMFPKEGRCPEGAQIGEEGCTWTIEATKVVLVSCVFAEGNVREAWQESFGKAPWPRMQAALLRGIAACADVREAAG